MKFIFIVDWFREVLSVPQGFWAKTLTEAAKFKWVKKKKEWGGSGWGVFGGRRRAPTFGMCSGQRYNAASPPLALISHPIPPQNT